MVILLDSVDKAFNGYIETKNHYKDNFEKRLAEQDYRKASELLWGVVAQSVKALAILNRKRLGTHPQIRSYVRQVSKETNDAEYYDLFLSVEKLHTNFYDEIIAPIDFKIYIRKTADFLEKTNELIQKKKKGKNTK